MSDPNGDYPTEEDLATIRAWDHNDPRGWFAFIKTAGHYWPSESFGWTERDEQDEVYGAVRTYYISTGGWSGNEDIIEAMGQNTMLWLITWVASRRGGHYEFQIRYTAQERNARQHDIATPKGES